MVAASRVISSRSQASDDPRPAPITHVAFHSLNGCQNLLNDLLETDPADLGRTDLALANLLCAPLLPGSERLDISRCLARLNNLTAFVKARTERNLHRFPQDPDYGHSEPMWRMAMLVTVVKRDFGAAYDPEVRADIDAGRHSLFIDSRNVFIHGLLADDPGRRWGSCSSIPVLIAAVARRLGYPVGLAVTRRHVFARWDNGEGICFNIEASNPAGMTSPDDEHFHAMDRPLTPRERRSGLFVRSLRPAEEFALFLRDRVWCLHDAGRYAEALLWSARALQFAPDEPNFAQHAYAVADLALKHRYWKKYPGRSIPPPERSEEFVYDLGDLLAVEERSPFLTIAAHHAESSGEVEKARASYEEACRQNFHGNNEQRDLQRFLSRHGPRNRACPRVVPKNLGQPRRITLPMCRPEDEISALHALSIRFERSGELLLARDALHDLYLLDPMNGEVFHRARVIERQPRFQLQLRNFTARRRAFQHGPEQSSDSRK